MKYARVLIVDDDHALLEALSESLQLRIKSIRVDTCDSASAALQRLSVTDYDAIVADIKIPGIDGLELLARIRELRPDTPTLLITGHGEHDLAVRALRGGAHDYVQKPIDRDYFVRSLSHAIERRRISRRVARRKQTLEKQTRELEKCLEDRAQELRELYQREAMSRSELERISAELQAARSRREELVSMIAYDEAPDRLPITCDRERMAQVFANLLGNAIAYAPGEIRVRVWRDGPTAQFSVGDRGPGIPQDSLETIFEPGVRLEARANSQGPGEAGLGLSIVREIVQAHGGRIWAESGRGEGTVFRAVLPVSVQRQPPATVSGRKQRRSSRRRAGSQIRVA